MKAREDYRQHQGALRRAKTLAVSVVKANKLAQPLVTSTARRVIGIETRAMGTAALISSVLFYQ